MFNKAPEILPWNIKSIVTGGKHNTANIQRLDSLGAFESRIHFTKADFKSKRWILLNPKGRLTVN